MGTASATNFQNKARSGQVNRCNGNGNSDGDSDSDGNIQSEYNGVLKSSRDGRGGEVETTLANVNGDDGGLDSGTSEESQSRGKEKHYVELKMKSWWVESWLGGWS